MIPRHALTVFLIGVLTVLTVPSVRAQSLSPDVKYLCGSASTATKIAHCSFQVPANTIGAKLMIEIPMDKVTQVTNLKAGDNISSSSVFFHLDVGTANGNISIRADFADLKGKASSAVPFPLFQFDLTLTSTDKSNFPLIIATLLKQDSEFHTPDSLAQNTTAFKAASDIPIPLTINASDANGTPVAGTFTPIPGSFTAIEDTGHAAAPPDFYCFSDPQDSMSYDEWVIICDAKKRGIISGNPQPDGRFYFLPNQPINRAEAAKMVTLGILRSLGKLSDTDFSAEEDRLKNESKPRQSILYPDIVYEDSGDAPWYAEYISVATSAKIVGGYPDKTYKPANKINNAESYRVIVETGRVASAEISSVLDDATRKTQNLDWYLKYAQSLDHYVIPFSNDYGKYTSRKEFLIIVMKLLKAVGL